MPIYFSEHAITQLKDRKIPLKIVKEVAKNPKEIRKSYRGRKLRRSHIGDKLLEVVTITEGSRITIITAYYLGE